MRRLSDEEWLARRRETSERLAAAARLRVAKRKGYATREEYEAAGGGNQTARLRCPMCDWYEDMAMSYAKRHLHYLDHIRKAHCPEPIIEIRGRKPPGYV